VDALILAAGLGTRLGEVGRDTPKALLEVGGTTMLEHVARAVVRAGATRLVVNAHHHAERIERFLDSHDLGAQVLVSVEHGRPLETGGGLYHARALFRRDRPILIHNVDVLTDAELRPLVAAHEASGALATLAVNQRETQRHLLFDDAGLCGREDLRHGVRHDARPAHGAVRRLAFAGIHVCAPALLDLITERGAFPIVDVYLRLAAERHAIRPWTLPGRWLEIGSLERLEAARRALEG
jgi:NDP-sugar pyrophosphorylase family protein